MYYLNEYLYVKGNYEDTTFNNDIFFFTKNIHFKNFFYFIGSKVATAYGIFIIGNNLRFSSNVQTIDKSSYIANHHGYYLHKIDFYLQFINSSMFEEPMTVVTDLCFNPKQKFINYLFNSFINIFFKNFSLKNFTTNEKYWAIVNCLGSNNSVSVFPDREGQQFLGDTKYYFRDGLFAASVYTQKNILNYVIVDKTEIDDFVDVHVQQFTPPRIESLQQIICKNENDYAQWRKTNFNLIWTYTLDCENKHKIKIKEFEDRKSSCALGHENEVCKISREIKNLENNIKVNKRYLAHKKKIGVKDI